MADDILPALSDLSRPPRNATHAGTWRFPDATMPGLRGMGRAHVTVGQ